MNESPLTGASILFLFPSGHYLSYHSLLPTAPAATSCVLTFCFVIILFLSLEYYFLHPFIAFSYLTPFTGSQRILKSPTSHLSLRLCIPQPAAPSGLFLDRHAIPSLLFNYPLLGAYGRGMGVRDNK